MTNKNNFYSEKNHIMYSQLYTYRVFLKHCVFSKILKYILGPGPVNVFLLVFIRNNPWCQCLYTRKKYKRRKKTIFIEHPLYPQFCYASYFRK